jgi:L-lactate dehydrogenase (cytochrome)
MPIAASVSDFRTLAEKRLPKVLFDYVDGGSFDEATLAANLADLRRIGLRQKVMTDVSKIDMSTTIFGRQLSMPLILAPVGFGGMMARRGEVQAARAAEKAGIPFSLSTVSVCPIEEVHAATTQPFWFQLYMMKDRGVVQAILERAQGAGCTTLLVTVDLAALGTRYRDIRNGMGPQLAGLSIARMAWRFAARPGWIVDVGLKGGPLNFGNLSSALKRNSLGAGMAYSGTAFDPSLNWKDLDWLRSRWKGEIVVKGVLDTDDAREAAANGADGVVVSNHGGRQLDAACSTISVLPRIAEAVGDKTTVLMDGGIRSGQDLTRALALGAKACLAGRAWVFAVAARGQTGVTQMIETMRNELRTTMALIGKTKIADIDRSTVRIE